MNESMTESYISRCSLDVQDDDDDFQHDVNHDQKGLFGVVHLVYIHVASGVLQMPLLSR